MSEDDGEIVRVSLLSQKRQDEINKVLTETDIQPMNIMDSLIEYNESELPLDVIKKLMYYFSF